MAQRERERCAGRAARLGPAREPDPVVLASGLRRFLRPLFLGRKGALRGLGGGHAAGRVPRGARGRRAGGEQAAGGGACGRFLRLAAERRAASRWRVCSASASWS